MHLQYMYFFARGICAIHGLNTIKVKVNVNAKLRYIVHKEIVNLNNN